MERDHTPQILEPTDLLQFLLLPSSLCAGLCDNLTQFPLFQSLVLHQLLGCFQFLLLVIKFFAQENLFFLHMIKIYFTLIKGVVLIMKKVTLLPPDHGYISIPLI